MFFNMDKFELNKIVATFLIGILIVIIANKISHFIYTPSHPEKRGFTVATNTQAVTGGDRATAKAVKEVIKLGMLIAQANVEHGKSLTKQCAACHSFEEAGANRVGPGLWGVVGRGKASYAGFSYSSAMSAKSAEKWTYEDLFAFIKSPRQFIDGTKMSFPGIKNDQDLADLIAYLHSISPGSPSLPRKNTEFTLSY